MYTFITKLIIVLVLVTSLGGGIYLAEQKVESWGYAKAEQKYQKILKDYEDKISKKIDAVEETSNNLVAQNKEYNMLLQQDIIGILKGIRGKTLTIVKDGACTPNQTFSDSFNEINKQANQIMKRSQK